MNELDELDDWQKFILGKLDHVEERFDGMENDLTHIKIQLAILETKLKTRAALWAAAGASLPIILKILWELLS